MSGHRPFSDIRNAAPSNPRAEEIPGRVAKPPTDMSLADAVMQVRSGTASPEVAAQVERARHTLSVHPDGTVVDPVMDEHVEK